VKLRQPDLPLVEITSRAVWRHWLSRHHTRSSSIWLVIWKKGRGPHVPYGDIVEEALCFGWIDSRPAKLDDDRSMLLLSPRKPGSAWSKLNKERVERLTAAGFMAAAGLRAVDDAKIRGTWTKLDSVETLSVPPDLEDAFAKAPAAREFFDNFPPSSRRGILEWIGQAKRSDTRAARIAETVRLAALNIKANFPKGRNAGPKSQKT